jgi:hypothetical protein
VKNYLVFNTPEEADKFVADLNTLYGYPDSDTDSYTLVKETVQGKYAVLTCPRCHDFMTEAQLTSLVSIKDALAFWPSVEVEGEL